MCSIFGITGQKDSDKRKETLRAMALDQQHRGPDDGGFFEDEMLAFGHRRLSVIDLSTNARQPMTNDSGDIVLVFNGEIYNYPELKKELAERGHIFRTSCDTECIIRMYEEYGRNAFSRLDGMFAIALYDKKEQKVFFLRDRMGKKPLFYFQSGNITVFGSELSVLKKHELMPQEFDMQSISDYLSLLYIPCPATIYKNVFKVKPGTLMTLDIPSNNITEEKYFHINFSENTSLSFENASASLRELVFEAVRKRLLADVPVGVFLSGGVDSSITTAVMTNIRAPQKTDAFTIGFDDPAYDERMRARHVAAFINEQNNNALLHHEKTVSPSDFSLLEKLIKHYGEPYADASMIPTALLSKFTGEKVTIALSGDGADELFCGYDRYFLMSKIPSFNLLPYPLRKFIFATLSSIIPSGNERTRNARIKRAFDVIAQKADMQYYRILDRCRSDFKYKLAGNVFRSELDKLQKNSILRLLDTMTSSSNIGKYMEFDQQTYLVGDILTKTDIASMAYSLELRCPFLDKDVVCFANSLPMHYKLNGKNKKHILKHAFKDMLPASIHTDSKKGFGVPVANYLRGAWHDQANDILFNSDILRSSGIFNMDTLKNIWQQHQSSRGDFSYQLWTVMIFAMFLAEEQK